MNRTRLRERIEAIVIDLDAHPLESQATDIAALAATHPHTIVQLASAQPLGLYNCVMHALGLDVAIMTKRFQYPLLYAETALITALMGHELRPCEPRPGAVVAWSSDGLVRHAGKLVTLHRAESKWGLGHLWAHGLDELPLRYGEVSGFYAAPDANTVMNLIEAVEAGR